jgi:aryl-phospho-beta-D-glucosidase BglC (GH1 family)
MLILGIHAAFTPTEAATPNPIAPGYLRTSGSMILDSQGREVRILGINWFGLSTWNRAPHGLWARNYKSMIAQMASMGFNTLRLLYSNDMLDDGPGSVSAVNFNLNPELVNKSPLQIMDLVIAAAGQEGMRVILDNHSVEPDAVHGKWYTASFTETQWINDWKMVATRYKNNPTVIGADLFNEPSGTWGTGAADDWARAAKAAGNAIHSVNGNWLIIVEGIRVWNNTWYWWGGGLEPVKTMPIVLNKSGKLVYSPHDYPPSVSGQPWFNDPTFPNNLPAVWEKHWGFIETQNIAPILIGEFGSTFANAAEIGWADTIADYIEAKGIDWMYFPFNANGQPYLGVLNQDWTTINPAKGTYIMNLIANTKM